DADRTGRRDRGRRRVAQRPMASNLPPAALPRGECPPPLGERDRSSERLVLEEGRQAIAELDRSVAVVGNTEADECIRPAHDAEPDLAGRLGGASDLGQWIPVGVDDIVEEADRVVDDLSESVPLEVAARDEPADVDRAKRARFERQ